MRLFKKKLNKPIVYTMKNCSYCKLTIEELEKANVSFTQKDIDEHRPEWEEVMLVTGLPKTPTIFFNDTYLLPMRDFRNPDQLIKLLKSLMLQARFIAEAQKPPNGATSDANKAIIVP